MFKKISLVFIGVGALSLLSCGDDTKSTPKQDKGGVVLPDGSTTSPDIGTTTNPEASTTNPEAGNPTDSFGKKCGQTSGACADTSMTCVITKQGSTEGFCSKECPVADFGTKPCSGGPTGTMPYCVLGDIVPTPTKAFCAFICQAKDTGTGQTITAPCPPELKCGTPDANGNAVCEP